MHGWKLALHLFLTPNTIFLFTITRLARNQNQRRISQSQPLSWVLCVCSSSCCVKKISHRSIRYFTFRAYLFRTYLTVALYVRGDKHMMMLSLQQSSRRILMARKARHADNRTSINLSLPSSRCWSLILTRRRRRMQCLNSNIHVGEKVI